VREERLDGNGALVETLAREVAETPAARVVTEVRRRADGRETRRVVRTETPAGRAILEKSTSGFIEEYAWDARNLLSRQTLREAVAKRPVMESAWSWQKSEAAPAFFSPPFPYVPVAWHESWKVGGIEGLRDRLVIRHRDATAHEERLAYVHPNGPTAMTLAASVDGVPQSRMEFDKSGRLARKTLLDEANRVRGRYDFGWDEKTGRLTSLSFRLGQGPAVRSLQFLYGARKAPAAATPDPLNPPDRFFTWGQGLYELARLRIGADAGNLELQGQDLAEALAWMERIGLERMIEADGRGEIQRLVRFVVQRPKNAVRWAFESYARMEDDEQRRAESRMAGAKARDPASLLLSYAGHAPRGGY
jgi:YD repeat-containing protein